MIDDATPTFSHNLTPDPQIGNLFCCPFPPSDQNAHHKALKYSLIALAEKSGNMWELVNKTTRLPLQHLHKFYNHPFASLTRDTKGTEDAQREISIFARAKMEDSIFSLSRKNKIPPLCFLYNLRVSSERSERVVKFFRV